MSSSWTEAIGHARAFVQTKILPHVPGLSVAVNVAGETVWSEGFGFANWEKKIPVTPATRFRVGSVAKPFTGSGLMLFVERGRIDLDAPLRSYLPDFPDHGATLTLRLRLVAVKGGRPPPITWKEGQSIGEFFARPNGEAPPR